MHLVNHDVLERVEKLRPFGVMRQDALVQHIGVRHHDIPVHAHRLARISGCVAVERVGPDAERAGAIEFEQFGDLILRQGFRGKEVEGFGLVRQDGL